MSDPLRLQWIKSLRQFRTGVRTLHRLGALDRVCDEVYELRNLGSPSPIRSVHSYAMTRPPKWSDPYWLTLLSTCIYEGRYTQELLRGFALSAVIHYKFGRPEPRRVVDAMNEVLKSKRALLKESFYNIHYSEVKSDE